ncbi:MAG: hypothetical protein U5N86_07860 [Planctomycetota bacterium]|nr:hypothetical protein [Planctomycetota bacterium]
MVEAHNRARAVHMLLLLWLTTMFKGEGLGRLLLRTDTETSKCEAVSGHAPQLVGATLKTHGSKSLAREEAEAGGFQGDLDLEHYADEDFASSKSDQIKHSIDTGNPVLFSYRTPDGPYHCVLIIGYKETCIERIGFEQLKVTWMRTSTLSLQQISFSQSTRNMTNLQSLKMWVAMSIAVSQPMIAPQ